MERHVFDRKSQGWLRTSRLMLLRLRIIVLVAALTIPMTVLSSHDAGTSLWGTSSVAAKGKKKNKKDKQDQPQFTTVTRTVREAVTQTFSNPTAIAIPATGSPSLGSPYPSAISVGGLSNGAITDVNLTLHAFTPSQFPDDIDILLAPSHLPGLNAVVLSDVGGGGGSPPNLTITLDDQAAESAQSPGGILRGGRVKPTDFGGPASDTWPGGPTPTGNVALAVFNGADPNGSWRLFVVDDTSGGTAGSISGGWSLEITAEVDRQIQEQVAVPGKDKQKKKKKK